MRSSGGGLLGSPIRVLELAYNTFGSAVFLYSLEALLLFSIRYSYLDGGRPGR